MRNHQKITILVTGANGQLGNEIRRRKDLFQDMEFLFTDVEDLDITSRQDLEQYFSAHSISWIINCAAYTAVDQAEDEPEKAALINHHAVKNLGDIAQKHQCPIIHISTDYVFDGTNHKPYNEDDPPRPNSIYGKTKRTGEQALENYDKAFILRTSWLYSSYGNNFVKTMLRLGKERDKLTVIFDQIGTPTYAGDLADACLHIVNESIKDEKAFYPGFYHFSNEGVCSWYDFAIEIMNQGGLSVYVEPIESKDFPQKAPRPFYSVMNKARIKSIYHMEIPYWKDSLEKCINELQNE